MDDSVTPTPPENDKDVTVVLAAIDTSALASRVVDLAARIARRTWNETQLHLVHVVRVAAFDRPASAGIHMQDLIGEAQNHLDFHVRMARRQYPSEVAGHLATGDPVAEIVRRARSLGADLLVIGMPEVLGLQKFLLGSVAEKVVKRAPCSIFIVRQKQRQYAKAA
jgi:nucleotide-binding universal stress UspA family protein